MSKFVPKNEGFVDRVIRVAIGIVFLPTGLVVLGGWEGSILGLAVAALGVIGLVTGAIGRCPTYVLLGGISTLPEAGTKAASGPIIKEGVR
jgi:hypothetical protein